LRSLGGAIHGCGRHRLARPGEAGPRCLISVRCLRLGGACVEARTRSGLVDYPVWKGMTPAGGPVPASERVVGLPPKLVRRQTPGLLKVHLN
jgi:hypothetical protein